MAADPLSVLTIEQVAQSYGVDPKLALAIATVESGINPNAIGDQGHSVGLYQLYDQGEGAGLSVAQRENPITNAQIALAQVQKVLQANPGIDPGRAAALAQRPADPAGYAVKVDAVLASGQLPVTGTDQNVSATTAGAPPFGGGAATQAGHALVNGVVAFGSDIWGGLLQPNIVGLAVGAVVLTILLSPKRA